MKTLTKLITCGLLAAVASSAWASTLAERLERQLTANSIPRAATAVMVMDADNGQTLYDHNATSLMTPASNTKLFSAVASLYALPENYRFHTSIKAIQTNPKQGAIAEPYVVFSGDPSLTTKDIVKLFAELKAHGVRRINGNISIDNHRFDNHHVYPDGMSMSDRAWRFMAPVSTVVIDHNAVGVTMIPSKTLGKLAVAVADSHNKWLKIDNTVKTVSTNASLRGCELAVDVNANNDVELTGCLAQREKPYHEDIALANPLAYSKLVIKRALAKAGIEFKGQIVNATAPKQAKTLVFHQSPAVTSLIAFALKESDNLYANALFKTLGVRYYGVGNYRYGSRAVQSILAAHTDIDFSKINLADGHGSRFNLIAPRDINLLLYAVYNDKKLKPMLLAALPNAGVDGTLQQRFKTFDLKNHIFAKTGTMHDMSALSGYLTTRHNRHLIFSILTNHVVGDIQQAKRLEDLLCAEMIRA